VTVNIEQLSAYYDGELAPEERRAVDAHLPECAECEKTLGRWLQVSRALAATAPGRVRPRRVRAVAVAAVAALLLLVSGIAVAGPFNEVFRIGNVSAVGSRPVTLDEARVANLPLPRAKDLPGGWNVSQVQLTVTSGWRSVDVQYRRPGSRGMGFTAWSQGIIVNPTAERTEAITVSGVPVEIGYVRGGSTTARFTHGESTVVLRVFADEVDLNGIRTLVAAWIEQAK
jgi:Putative zinc-finger